MPCNTDKLKAGPEINYKERFLHVEVSKGVYLFGNQPVTQKP